MKSGRSRAGTRAASSHTAALASRIGPSTPCSTRPAWCGWRRSRSSSTWGRFSLTSRCRTDGAWRSSETPGGPGVLAADACISHGLEVPEFPGIPASSGETASARGRPQNPIDMVARATAAGITGLTALLGLDEIDAIIVIFTPPLVTRRRRRRGGRRGYRWRQRRSPEQSGRGELSGRRGSTPDPAPGLHGPCRATRIRRTQPGHRPRGDLRRMEGPAASGYPSSPSTRDPMTHAACIADRCPSGSGWLTGADAPMCSTPTGSAPCPRSSYATADAAVAEVNDSAAPWPSRPGGRGSSTRARWVGCDWTSEGPDAVRAPSRRWLEHWGGHGGRGDPAHGERRGRDHRRASSKTRTLGPRSSSGWGARPSSCWATS